jgi:hypothetical protein
MKCTHIPNTMTPDIHCRERAAKRRIRRAVKAKVGTLVGAILRKKSANRLTMLESKEVESNLGI